MLLISIKLYSTMQFMIMISVVPENVRKPHGNVNLKSKEQVNIKAKSVTNN